MAKVGRGETKQISPFIVDDVSNPSSFRNSSNPLIMEGTAAQKHDDLELRRQHNGEENFSEFLDV